jgi:hypothetical protein
MYQQAENILAALRTRQFANLLQDPGDQEALFRDLLTALTAAGFAVVKPSVLELDAPAQIKSCLRIAHYSIHGKQLELAADKVEVALHVTQALEDYLRELGRLGTQVPLTWAEFVQREYYKKFADKTGAFDNVGSNGSKDENGIPSKDNVPVPAEGY